MYQQNTVATLDGNFKVVYGEGPVRVVPDVALLQKEIPFQKSEKIGKSYNFPVILSNEAGVTYLAAGAGVTTLNDSVAAQLKEASVDANQIIIRGQMDYEAAAKAVTSKESFKSSTELLVLNLQETGGQRVEIGMLYGRSSGGLGIGDTSANASATSTVVTFTAASWSPGIWSGKENAVINFYKTSDDSLISSSTDAIFTISAVNFDNRTLTVTGTATGITALDTHLSSGNAYVHWKNAKTAEMYGLEAIARNTGSLFGISATDYAMWGGSSYDFSGAVSTAKLLNMAGKAVSKGGLIGEAAILISPKAFMYLAGTMTDLRRQNGGQKENTGIAGFETIVLMGPNGKLNVVPHPMMKEGEALLVPFKQIRRIGTQEFSFQTPGRKDELFLHIPDKNAYELRLYCAQAIVCLKPAQLVYGYGITY
jgi:hypothetical protein